jgi:hypothetical protein
MPILEHPVLDAKKKINTQSAPERENLEGRPTVVRSFNCNDDPASQGRQDNDFEAPPEIRSFWCNALIFEARVAEMQLHWAVLIMFLRGESS